MPILFLEGVAHGILKLSFLAVSHCLGCPQPRTWGSLKWSLPSLSNGFPSQKPGTFFSRCQWESFSSEGRTVTPNQMERHREVPRHLSWVRACIMWDLLKETKAFPCTFRPDLCAIFPLVKNSAYQQETAAHTWAKIPTPFSLTLMSAWEKDFGAKGEVQTALPQNEVSKCLVLEGKPLHSWWVSAKEVGVGTSTKVSS